MDALLGFAAALLALRLAGQLAGRWRATRRPELAAWACYLVVAVLAAQGGMAEVALGNLALQQGSSPKVKDFGKKLADDYSKANDELTQIASREGINLPSGMDMKQQQTVERFSKLSGAQFDKEYMRHMVEDHEKEVAKFQTAAKSLQDPDLKAWALKTLPTLNEHLRMAKDIHGQIEKKAK